MKHWPVCHCIWRAFTTVAQFSYILGFSIEQKDVTNDKFLMMSKFSMFCWRWKMEREERKEIMKKSRFNDSFTSRCVKVSGRFSSWFYSARREEKKKSRKIRIDHRKQHLLNRPQVRLGPGMAPHGEWGFRAPEQEEIFWPLQGAKEVVRKVGNLTCNSRTKISHV